MKTILCICACLFLVSCKAAKGDLDIHESITLLKKKSLFSSKLKKVKIPAGNYKATLKASSKKKIKLKIKDVKGKDLSIPFLIPENFELKEGDVELSSQVTKQPYDLAISIAKNSNSQVYDTTESCVSHYIESRECHWVSASTSCHTEGGHEVCRTKPSGEEVCYTTSSRQVCSTTPGYTSCHNVSTPVYGSQQVTYESVTTTKTMIVRLKEVENIKATFDHESSDTNRHQLSSSACY